MTGLPQQAGRKRGIPASSDCEQTSRRQRIMVNWVETAAGFRDNSHEIFGREIDLVPVEELTHAVNQQVPPPRNLVFGEASCLDFNDGRRSGLPITEAFDQAKVEDEVLKGF